MIDGDDDYEERHEVTKEDFVRYTRDRPDYLDEKLEQINQRYEDCINHGEAQVAERRAAKTG